VKRIITQNAEKTKDLGKRMARKINPGTIVCLSGNLGSGKTTFAQGFLKGLGAKGPFTSPTFSIIKPYTKKIEIINSKSKFKIIHIYHIDAYRVSAKDFQNLGWEEIVNGNIVIIEWAERIRKIIPKNATWIKFRWINEKMRELTFVTKKKAPK